MDTTANIAEIEQVNALTLKLFSTPRSQHNFSPAENALLKKYGIIGKTSKSEYARAYTTLS